jgi:ADP-ribose pyrophosphatase
MEINRKKVFSGRLIQGFKVRKRLPDGREAYFEEIQHPEAALVVPFFKGRIVFIRQYRGVIGKSIWELPAGIMDKGESPRACAFRELAEETGYASRRMKKIGIVYTSPGFCDERIHIFSAECGARGASRMDEYEIIRVKLFTKDEVRRMLDRGRITDAKTVAALCLAGVA